MTIQQIDIIALIGAAAAIITAVSVALKNRQSAKTEFIDKLLSRIDQLDKRIVDIEKKSDCQDMEIDKLREQLRLAQIENTELKEQAKIKDARIEELETEIADLRLRLEIVEKRKVNGGKA